MLKKYIIFIIIFLCTQLLYAMTIETERTLWVPWTPEHTQLWETYEQQDTSTSNFRRNEYFEDMQTLIQRDKNLDILYNLLSEHTRTSFIIPSLGFAILDKKTNELIGTTLFKLSSKKEYLSVSHSLKHSIRCKKFGSEVVAQIVSFINTYKESPIPTLKEKNTKEMFTTAWHEQGKQEKPNFDTLLNFFEKKTIYLKGIFVYIDSINHPSLAIAHNNNIQVDEIECNIYHVHEGPNFFSFNIVLVYPSLTNSHNEYNIVVQNLLSKDNTRIQYTYNVLKKMFNIPSDWIYISLTRDEKKYLNLIKTKYISTLLLSDFKKSKL